MTAPDRDARVDGEIAAPLRAASAGPDELHAARLAAAIDAALDREDGERAARRQRAAQGPATRRRRVVAGAVAAAVLVLAIAFRSHRAPAPAPLPAATVNAAGEPPRDGPPALLRRSPGSDPGGATPSTSLVAPRGERARATIGTRVRLTLVGAGRVSVLPAARDGDIELSLEGGRLLVDYDGHAGGTLRVRSPGATTTVVGTLFAVEVTESGSRVAVARGRVRTQDPTGRDAEVGAGTSWTSSDGRSVAISDDLSAALAAHQRDWTEGHGAPDPDRGGAATQRAPQPRRVAAADPPRSDLDALYARAEAAMRARSLGEARRALETIAARDPRGPLGEAALLDLARLALADGDRAEARRALARLPTPMRDRALADTAAHLRCRAQEPGAAADDCDAPVPAPTP